MSIDVSRLTFADVSEETHGSFVKSENLDAFLATPLGEAQVESMVEEMKQQMGDENYEPTDSTIKRALFSEQAAQDIGQGNGGRDPDVTNQQMLDDHGPEWYQDIGGALVGLWDKAVEFKDDLFEPIEPDPERSMYGIAESPTVTAMEKLGL